VLDVDDVSASVPVNIDLRSICNKIQSFDAESCSLRIDIVIAKGGI